MYHYRVLPTDERWRRLNNIQKLALWRTVQRKDRENVDLAMAFFEMLKPWLNLELFRRDREQGKEAVRENVAFEDQTRKADATGWFEPGEEFRATERDDKGPLEKKLTSSFVRLVK